WFAMGCRSGSWHGTTSCEWLPARSDVTEASASVFRWPYCPKPWRGSNWFATRTNHQEGEPHGQTYAIQGRPGKDLGHKSDDRYALRSTVGGFVAAGRGHGGAGVVLDRTTKLKPDTRADRHPCL